MSTASVFFLLTLLASPTPVSFALTSLAFSFACVDREVVNSLDYSIRIMNNHTGPTLTWPTQDFVFMYKRLIKLSLGGGGGVVLGTHVTTRTLVCIQ